MTYEEMQAFKRKYSKAFRNNSGPWITNELEMSKKTVLKRILKRNPLNEFFVNRALQTDQAVFFGENDFIYIDNEKEDEVVSEVVTNEHKEAKKSTVKKGKNITNEVVTDVDNEVDNEVDDDIEIPF